MSYVFLGIFWIWKREPRETKVVCSLGQDNGPGHGVLEDRYLVKKKEGAAGDLGVTSFFWTRRGCLVSGV